MDEPPADGLVGSKPAAVEPAFAGLDLELEGRRKLPRPRLAIRAAPELALAPFAPGVSRDDPPVAFVLSNCDAHWGHAIRRSAKKPAPPA